MMSSAFFVSKLQFLIMSLTTSVNIKNNIQIKIQLKFCTLKRSTKYETWIYIAEDGRLLFEKVRKPGEHHLNLVVVSLLGRLRNNTDHRLIKRRHFVVCLFVLLYYTILIRRIHQTNQKVCYGLKKTKEFFVNGSTFNFLEPK